MSPISQFFGGIPSQYEQKPLLGPEQQPLLGNLTKSLSSQGAGGAFGNVADYYRSLMGGNSPDFQAMIQPELRQFRQETLPSLANQFAGLGAGALNSSGYRNAALQAGTDLSERLASLRANLRQQGASGLSSLGSQGLQQYYANVFRPRQPGFLEQVAPAIGSAIGMGLGGGGLSSLANFLGGLFSNRNSLEDSISSNMATGPYGSGASYNPSTGVQ